MEYLIVWQNWGRDQVRLRRIRHKNFGLSLSEGTGLDYRVWRYCGYRWLQILGVRNAEMNSVAPSVYQRVAGKARTESIPADVNFMPPKTPHLAGDAHGHSICRAAA